VDLSGGDLISGGGAPSGGNPIVESFDCP